MSYRDDFDLTAALDRIAPRPKRIVDRACLNCGAISPGLLCDDCGPKWRNPKRLRKIRRSWPRVRIAAIEPPNDGTWVMAWIGAWRVVKVIVLINTSIADDNHESYSQYTYRLDDQETSMSHYMMPANFRWLPLPPDCELANA